MLRQLLCMVGCFILSSNAIALYSNINKKTSCIINKDHMPKFKVTFDIPAEDAEDRYVVLRYFQPWGDASRTGWQTPIELPSATLSSGQPLPVVSIFAYSSQQPNYLYGAVELGYDQYAQYLAVDLPSHTWGSQLIISGTFQQAAYLSATLYSHYPNETSEQKTILEREMMTLDDACNPYLEGNLSVFSYPSQAIPRLTKDLTIPSLSLANLFRPLLAKKPSKTLTSYNTGKIDVYRLDQQSSKADYTDDIAPDGCTRAYLAANKTSEQEVIILRIKVPTTFINSDNPDKIFGHYQTRYFSVGSHRQFPSDSDILLTYWSVNARMLEDYIDKDGYAYVFFAPNSYTNNLAIQQNTPPTQPPVMTWGKYKGYLLGDPDFSIILRYRDPDPNWKGSPENAICYATAEEGKPVTRNELGKYLPEIYGDTMENFLKGKIGIVTKNGRWPD